MKLIFRLLDWILENMTTILIIMFAILGYILLCIFIKDVLGSDMAAWWTVLLAFMISTALQIRYQYNRKNKGK